MTTKSTRRHSLTRFAALGAGAAALGLRFRGEAAPGDSLVLGRRNDAAGRQTGLRSSVNDGAALSVVNASLDGTAVQARSVGGFAVEAIAKGVAASIKGDTGLIVQSDLRGIDVNARRGPAIWAVSHGRQPAVVAQTTSLKAPAVTASAGAGTGHFGTALDTTGRLLFHEVAGKVKVPAGDSEVDVRLAGKFVFLDSLILATVQQTSDAGVLCVQPLDEASFRIRLTGPTARDVSVGYLVLN
jgi:hypothetical protein